MERSRGSSFNQHKDELLCRVYLEISQNPIGSNNQSLGKLWEKIENSYNEKKDECWEIRSTRSLQDIPKFTDNVNIGIQDTPNTEINISGSPTSQSPGVSSFSINLSSDDGGSNSSQRPIGSKKAKLKRKLAEERIIKKRTQEQQQPSVAPEIYGKYFGDIGGP
uniref:No apical meristem-associated C-terminal domain-containing protein n=1 Tax=Brassica oleracea var. oleracea TaxID=109376 RepID=A0A0D3CZW6_BRAOL